MKRYIPSLQPQLLDAICDICGKEAPIGAFSQFRGEWGFVSKFDLELWEADLCESCSEKFKAWVESLGGKVRVGEGRL